MSYYFDSTGACELCDAMSGYYETEPCPPHPNCNCPINDGSADSGPAVDFDWSYERGPARGWPLYTVPIKVTVECYSGRTMIESMELLLEQSDLPRGFLYEFIDDE